MIRFFVGSFLALELLNVMIEDVVLKLNLCL